MHSEVIPEHPLEDLIAVVTRKPGHKNLCPTFCATQIANVMDGKLGRPEAKEAAQDALIEIVKGSTTSVGAIYVANERLKAAAKSDPALKERILKSNPIFQI